MCATTDCQLGALEALIFVMVGILISLLVYALWPHRHGPDEPPGPPPGPDDEDPIAFAPDDFDPEAWLERNTVHEIFEGNLLEDLSRGGSRHEEDVRSLIVEREPRARFGFWLGVR